MRDIKSLIFFYANLKTKVKKHPFELHFMTIRNLYLLLYCLIFEPESKSTCYEFA